MIAWVDVETTGLDPEHGYLLEVALVFTDDELNVLGDAFSRIVRPSCSADYNWYRALEPVVFNMHAASGLLQAVHAGEGVSIKDVQAEAIEFSSSHGDLKSTPLAGSTVGFDRAWLKKHMPGLESLFSYRSVDVSSVKELCRRWAPGVAAARPKPSKPAHRALADVMESIEELRYYRSASFVGGR